jgi:DNA-binding response OmpR family regulator
MKRLVVDDAAGVHESTGVALDAERRMVRLNGRWTTLRAKEFDLLRVLLQHAGMTLSRERLLALVWDYPVPVKTRTVDVHVNHLRRKLAGSGLTIETVRGVGYRLVERQR